uniref:Uncharacterized protein n=1 Tax=Arundo donax TaxID=35708 RepID=A0A0A9H8H6_ARUDO
MLSFHAQKSCFSIVSYNVISSCRVIIQ